MRLLAAARRVLGGRSLSVHLAAGFAVMSFIPALTLGLHQGQHWAAAHTEQADQALKATAEAVARQIEDMVWGHVSALEVVAAQIEAQPDMEPRHVSPLLAALSTRYGAFAMLYVADASGRSLVAEPSVSADGAPTAGVDYSDRDYYQHLVASGQTVLSRLQVGKKTAVPNIQVATPIEDSRGRLRAYVCGSIDLRLLQNIVERAAVSVPGTALVVLDHHQRVIAHTAQYATLDDLSAVSVFGAPASVATEMRTAPNHEGVIMRAAATPVRTLDIEWTVVSAQPRATIAAIAAAARRDTLAMSAITALIGMLLAAVLASFIARPIRELARFADTIGTAQVFPLPPTRDFLPREVVSLSGSLANMKHRVESQAEVLEVAVTTRTAELTAANQELAANMNSLREAQSRLALAERMASLGTLIAGVGHEINNPLAYVIANLEYVLQDLAHGSSAGSTLGPDSPQALKEALEGAHRIKRIVVDLKVFARPDSERTAPINVEQVIETAANMAANEIRHRARLTKAFTGVSMVLGNPSRLGQVVLNLLINAAQAIPEGAADRNEIRISTRLDARGRVIIEVRDTGAGIAHEHLSRIFDPFFTTKPVGQGTGLGLAICHRIVSEMQGKILVDSEPGRGATFRVVLPAAAPADTGPSEVATSPHAYRASVLIVDDEPLVGKAMARTLSPLHEVTVLTSANEALERLRRGELFDIVICDLMMPEMTGMDLYASVQSARADLASRFVFVTGGAFTPSARRFLDTVANPRFEKPCGASELRAAIDTLLKSHPRGRRASFRGASAVFL